VNSHSVAVPIRSLHARKTPVQARSATTVAAIFTASIQVLKQTGLARLTTTRVAERAGVSVGTLYQHFPNKQALLAAVLEQHLTKVVDAVETACVAQQGHPVAAMAQAVVQAFISAKLDDAEASRALYAVAAELGGAQVGARLSQRSQIALGRLLATASDRRITDPALTSYVLSTALVGPVQGLLMMQPSPLAVAALRVHLASLASSYLCDAQVSVPALHRKR
jgi:AcrR family transcriptional regulator